MIRKSILALAAIAALGTAAVATSSDAAAKKGGWHGHHHHHHGHGHHHHGHGHRHFRIGFYAPAYYAPTCYRVITPYGYVRKICRY